jgi:hypothetical protein
MDKEARNLVQRATQDARRLLEREYREQLEGLYDVLPDTGEIADTPGNHLDAHESFIRSRIVAAIEHERSKVGDREAIEAYMREAAFTTLNRFAALKLMEARRLVQECVSKADQSRGFREFCGLAPGLSDLPDRGYRLYLECLFDEVGVEVGALFDRRHPASLLWPRRPAMLELLEILNRADLAVVWSEDETIGWIYQYFNNDAERKEMRQKSAAPRNSRELAVRNQFFTPRYVVQFLTDNTLGRIWYEMLKGETALKDRCHYMVRRPHEVFLHRDETASEAVQQDRFSQEELLRQPVYIPHRPLKDPRTIRLLDPSCGSMHFGLYAFDLYETIYAEAWEIAKSGQQPEGADDSFSSFITHISAFQTKSDFLRQVPAMILENNIHGIDIDLRATQIAGFALWLRAQRSWAEQGLRAPQRPLVRKTNVVCAEPMPGDREVLNEFTARLKPPFLAQIVEKVWETMQLAGEAGSLLKIEEQIANWVRDAKKQWRDLPKTEQLRLFEPAAEYGRKGPRQQELPLDLTGITDERFWEEAEERIYDALREFAALAPASNLRQRLFADDALHGFAFVDLCRKRYDAVVMNPPFGSFSKLWMAESKAAYPNSANDILAAFVERFLHRLYSSGKLGAITSRTCFFLTTFKDWRLNVVLKKSAVRAIADLGQGVMDDAMVEAAAYVLENTQPASRMAVFRAIADADRQVALESCLEAHREGKPESRLFLADQATFHILPDSPFVYWIDGATVRRFLTGITFEPSIANVKQGLSTSDNYRFVRAVWEVRPHDTAFCYYPLDGTDICNYDDPVIQDYLRRRQFGSPKWAFHVMAGSSQPWYSPITVKVNFFNSGDEIANFRDANGKPKGVLRNREFYYRPGFSWTRRAVRFYPYVVPSNCIPSASRYMAYPDHGLNAEAVGVCASRLASAFLRFYAEFWQRPNFLVDTLKKLPWPDLPGETTAHVEKLISREVEQRRLAYQNHEPFQEFLLPVKVRDFSRGGEALAFSPESLLDEETEAMVTNAFGFSKDQARVIERDLLEAIDYQKRGGSSSEQNAANEREEEEGEESDTEGDFVLDYSASALEEAHVSYLVGCVLGRWDVRFATGQRQPPNLPDPFAPLPVCPPGTLQNAKGLPAEPTDVPATYPLRITWSGILVDDPGHPDDIEARVLECLQAIWGNRAEAIEAEACKLLGVFSLREYFRKQSFTDHLNRYSKSRRQAPIYWPFSTATGSYTIWLYYHRFTRDMFYRVGEIADEKFRHEERNLFTKKEEAGPNPNTAQAKALHAQEKFVEELREFGTEIARVAPLWRPNLNDGVIINFAPFHRLISHTKWQKDVAACWEKLVNEGYDWAHLAMHLWPERVIPKCATDRSLAIAHGLDEVFWQPNPAREGKYRAKTVPKSELERLVAERSSPAVKAALKSLETQPSRPHSRKRRKSS